jgi:RHS repeat-associated protein
VAYSTKLFTPFGEYRIDAPDPTDDISDRGFTGHKHNDYIKMIYMGARFYLPGLGRFASADSIVPNPANPQTHNRYSYTINNPLFYVYPDGHDLMIVGGLGGNLNIEDWEEWIIAYKGWSEDQWTDFFNQWVGLGSDLARSRTRTTRRS